MFFYNYVGFPSQYFLLVTNERCWRLQCRSRECKVMTSVVIPRILQIEFIRLIGAYTALLQLNFMYKNKLIYKKVATEILTQN
jgi:hypothetical protein